MFRKYWQVFDISWSSGFIYRLNFIMWRVRNVIQLLAIFFLWSAILKNQTTVFTYSGAALLTYVLGSALVRAVVFSNQSNTIQAEISSGDLSNYLVKPVNYFTYWFSRDFADKLLNVVFSVGEIALLILLLKPALYIPSSGWGIGLTIVTLVLATIMYYYFNILISLTVFWMPEGSGWPQRFFLMVITDFLSGSLFPLDILPAPLTAVFSHLPTAYFLYVPLQIYLGRLVGPALLESLLFMFGWIILLWWGSSVMFRRGLRIYGAYGK